MGVRLAHRVHDRSHSGLLGALPPKELDESPEFEKTKATGKIERSPFLSLFKPPQLWDFLQVFLFMTGLFLADYSVYGFLPDIFTLKGRGFNTDRASRSLRAIWVFLRRPVGSVVQRLCLVGT